MMKKIVSTIVCAGILGLTAFNQTTPVKKVFISVDMEGVTGVVHWEEVGRNGKDYDYFRELMTLETNAAIEAALEAGAEEILVRDSHGSARNILPTLLHEKARLMRDWSGGYKSMMEGIDESFDAVIFIGYHARAGTTDSPLAHTMNGNIKDISINGISMPEAGINGLIAGMYGVPVVFISGDVAICRQATGLFGEVETVAVKEGFGNASLNLHPAAARQKIKEGVLKALSRANKYKPYTLPPPYTMVLQLNTDDLQGNKEIYPGTEKTGQGEFTFKSNDLLEILKAFYQMR
jgi:D-amino peptidase